MKMNLSEEGIKVKNEALSMLREKVNRMFAEVPTDPTNYDLHQFINLQELAEPEEIMAVVFGEIRNRISEIKNQWTAMEWEAWATAIQLETP
jgi:superfamily II DNA/RNA helicase